ncbi:hypothetical protein KP509_37G040400 [Ceratopteris richardii]|uniref:Transmembrane protein 230 n=1 Tax=Ceratopteris richardii TaxID=49495 RepID=A0A8T2Q797_CERRI|nr:hypothetical protein KP509_37G040400 [Ceratopteris richardii]
MCILFHLSFFVRSKQSETQLSLSLSLSLSLIPTMADRPHIRYSALSTEQQEELLQPRARRRHIDEDDGRFTYDPFKRVPWKSIALAIFLLFFGTLCLLVSYLIYSEHMGGDSSQVYGFLIIGLLIFIPGFYETRIAYYSMRGANGYAFSQIPQY